MVISISQSVIQKCSEANVVTARNLNKRYKNGTEALKGISLDINKGDLFGLIGPDGAGKSTLLRILAGVMEASSGSVVINGTAPRDARRLIGYVPENCALYSELTVEENLRYQAGLYGVSAQCFATLRDTHLKNMGLLKFSNRLAGHLSGGMKQKLALCCALVSEPQLILLDEPTTGLDPIARRELWQILAGLSREGVTAVVATPFLDEAERCNRIALMYEGSIQQTGTPPELQKALQMRRLEVTLTDEQRSRDVLKVVESVRFKHIKDIYLYGDHLEILTQDARGGAAELRELLSSKNIDIGRIDETEPTMENVFVTRLREFGVAEIPPIQFPQRRISVNSANWQQNDIAIRAQNLNKNFKDFRAVENVELEIRFGEIYGLLGANGAGKSTTIKMLCGLLKPTSGTVVLAGESKDLRSRDIRKRIGYMSQKFTLYDGLTVAENLQFYASIYEIPLNLRARRMDWVIQVCDLAAITKSVVGRLPLGCKQRIAFGAAVMHEPDIMFLDEPTAGVDPVARRQLWNLIRDFAVNKAAILITTHYLDEAEYCNRLAFMAGGKIITQGSGSEIKSQLQGQVMEVKTYNTQDGYRSLSSALGHRPVSVFGDSIHVLVDNLEQGTQAITTILRKAGCETKSIRPIACSLEDAFIDIVQRSQGD